MVSYSGVDQTSPTSAVFPAAGTTGPVRVTVTAPDSRPVLGMACLGGTWAMRAGPDATPGPSDVSLWDFTEHDVVGLGGQQTAQGGGTVSWNIVWPDTFAWSAAGLSITPASAPPPPPDAGPDATPDAEPDLSPPDDLFTPPDLAADLPPPPEAGVDAQEAADAGQAADGDTDAEADGGVMDAGAEDSAVTPDLSPVDGDPGGTTVRDVDLHVGCACRLGGHGRPSLLVGLALAFLIARRRR